MAEFRKRTYSQLYHHCRYNPRTIIAIKFPSGKIIEGELDFAIDEDHLKITIDNGWFRQGWALMLRPRLVPLLRINYSPTAN